MSYHRCDIAHTSNMNIFLWTAQNGWTPLLCAAREGHFPVVEYLMEKGADVEAKDEVSDVISWMWTTHTSHVNIHVNVSEWVDSINVCCKTKQIWCCGIPLCMWGWYTSSWRRKYDMCIINCNIHGPGARRTATLHFIMYIMIQRLTKMSILQWKPSRRCCTMVAICSQW